MHYRQRQRALRFCSIEFPKLLQIPVNKIDEKIGLQMLFLDFGNMEDGQMNDFVKA